MDGTVTITLQSVAQISATPPHYSYFNLIFDFFFPPLTAALIAAAILSQKQKSTADLECECETFSAAKS